MHTAIPTTTTTTTITIKNNNNNLNDRRVPRTTSNTVPMPHSQSMSPSSSSTNSVITTITTTTTSTDNTPSLLLDPTKYSTSISFFDSSLLIPYITSCSSKNPPMIVTFLCPDRDTGKLQAKATAHVPAGLQLDRFAYGEWSSIRNTLLFLIKDNDIVYATDHPIISFWFTPETKTLHVHMSTNKTSTTTPTLLCAFEGVYTQ